ncbi:TonB-dependent receptor [Novosphingobium profundi]|uniref:TonB-dependent receptor n=1 Tax=Novosphingobium profundi TaxID=1774954 RepID=UPI001BDA2248|nr:TonB-dependent receptor [Novosphingobium profundi]MBT0670759.1 TonB-dependent receptor [Novosphingobium profundi]
MNRMHSFMLAGASMAALLAGTAQAQTEAAPAASSGNQIVVTAQRREETVQDVPISINAFSNKQLTELGVKDTSDLAALSPGVSFNAVQGGSNPIISIRGLSLNDTFGNNNPTVGLYLDNVIQPFTPMMSGQIYDVERVEVLKGPQGTLYGRNTTGGAINIISRAPTFERQGYVKASYARFDRAEIEGALGGGITDTLAGRFSFKTTQQRGGWQKNTATGETIGDVNETSLRGQLLWQPTDAFDATLKLGYTKTKQDVQLREHVGFYATDGSGDYCASALAGVRDETNCMDFFGAQDTSPGRRTVDDSELYGHQQNSRLYNAQLTMNYDLGAATLTSITAYNDFHRTLGDDSDGSNLIELDSLYTDDIESFTQELRATSNGDGPFNYVAGLYYSYDRVAGSALQALDDTFFHTRADTSYVQKTDAVAGFGQIGYHLTPQLELVGGLRFTHENKRYDYDAVDLDPYGDSTLPALVAGIENGLKEDNLSGKVGINFKASDDLLLYASASKGFKSGGFKAAIAFSEAETDPFKGETVYAYEAGLKSTLLDGRMTFNLAGYYNNWKDFQAMVTEVRSGVNVIVLSNAGDAHIYGVEGELNFQPTDALSLRASANLMHSEIVRFNNAEGGDDYTGNKLANAPDFTMSAQARWELPVHVNDIGVYVMGDASYKSTTYYSLANRILSGQEGYWLVNGRIGVHNDADTWEVAAFGKNIFNKLYVSSSYDNWGGIFPSENYLGDPATYGVEVTYNF